MTPFDVSPAAAHEVLPACRMLFTEAVAEHCRNRLLAEADTTGLFVARDSDSRLRAATLVQLLPGAAGVIVPPRGDSATAREAVAVPACAWLRARGVKVCQAFAAPAETEYAVPLERHGFRHVTQLVFMQCEAGSVRDVPSPTLRWSAWPERPAAEQLDLLLATHEGTLDCPELNAPRTPAEIVAGFQPDNITDRMWWTCRDESGTPVGVLLVLGGPGGVLEISYLGLVAAARGRGLSRAIIRFAERVASDAEYRSLSVSVDARNTPAMRLYARHGFVEYDRREVWLAAWPG
jgi:ribosomal protein S18 acetylase RimI-like enzyme